jgi:peroxin-19
METMMKELEGLMENGEFDDVFGNVLQQLVSKELLFEPMKELSVKVTVHLI